MDPSKWIEQGGFATAAAILAIVVRVLWLKLQEVRIEQRADREKCSVCQKEHAAQILELAQAVVRGLDQNTDALDALRHDNEIYDKLEALEGHVRERETGQRGETGHAIRKKPPAVR